jgi:hypothetical protein
MLSSGQFEISFLDAPNVVLEVESKTKVRQMLLPFQDQIETVIMNQFKYQITKYIKKKMLGTAWLQLNKPKKEVSLLLSQYNAISKYPFAYDTTDDPEVLKHALAIIESARLSAAALVDDMETKKAKIMATLALHM